MESADGVATVSNPWSDPSPKIEVSQIGGASEVEAVGWARLAPGEPQVRYGSINARLAGKLQPRCAQDLAELDTKLGLGGRLQVLEVQHSGIADEARGRGLGLALYLALMKYAAADPRDLMAIVPNVCGDGSTSDPALATWDRLRTFPGVVHVGQAFFWAGTEPRAKGRPRRKPALPGGMSAASPCGRVTFTSKTFEKPARPGAERDTRLDYTRVVAELRDDRGTVLGVASADVGGAYFTSLAAEDAITRGRGSRFAYLLKVEVEPLARTRGCWRQILESLLVHVHAMRANGVYVDTESLDRSMPPSALVNIMATLGFETWKPPGSMRLLWG